MYVLKFSFQYLIVTKGHTYLKKTIDKSFRLFKVCMKFCHHQVLKGQFVEKILFFERIVLPVYAFIYCPFTV